ncbi:hypothetical protein CB1_000811011 [Camelus ferus]|nr:hypothetical protein CB1_000811011 [Camelus ferus]
MIKFGRGLDMEELARGNMRPSFIEPMVKEEVTVKVTQETGPLCFETHGSQKSTELLIQKLPFQKWVREMAQDFETDWMLVKRTRFLQYRVSDITVKFSFKSTRYRIEGGVEDAHTRGLEPSPAGAVVVGLAGERDVCSRVLGDRRRGGAGGGQVGLGHC